MKELTYDSVGSQDYRENSPDLFDPTFRTDIPYSRFELLIIQDTIDQIKLAKEEEISNDDIAWTLSIRELADEIGDKKVVFRLNEQGLLHTEIIK